MKLKNIFKKRPKDSNPQVIKRDKKKEKLSPHKEALIQAYVQSIIDEVCHDVCANQPPFVMLTPHEALVLLNHKLSLN